MFQRRHYEAIAEKLGKLLSERRMHAGMHRNNPNRTPATDAHLRGQVDGVEQVADVLADHFETDNPAFNRDQWYAAIGIEG